MMGGERDMLKNNLNGINNSMGRYSIDWDELTAPDLAADMDIEIGRVAPDTAGADKFFIDGFLTEEMAYDFWTIARDFLKRHFTELTEYGNLACYGNDLSNQSDPERALQIRLMNVMYNAAKSGDPYSVALLKHLYKIYHKKEYKQLKRFRRISVSEILSLSDFNGCQLPDIGRILGMCSVYGIQMEDECELLYSFLNKRREEWDEEDEIPFFFFKEGLFQECRSQVEAWQEEERTKSGRRSSGARKFERIDKFVKLCLARQGFPEDYVYRCNQEFINYGMLFSHTLALLKSAFPKEDFTFEEVQTYAHILSGIDALVSVSCEYDQDISELFGITEDRHVTDGEECLFHPEDVAYSASTGKREAVKPIHVAPVAKGDAKEADYLEEISGLRTRLQERNRECKHFKNQYDQARALLEEQKELLSHYENDREELIALRNHVYNLSEEEPDIEPDRLDEMRKEIAGRSIAIVGGHVNWVNKLRKEFPGWRFLDAEITRLNEAAAIDGVERVYFFTNHLSHGTYGKFISLVRERKISFGYLHTVNMETMVRQIYGELQD